MQPRDSIGGKTIQGLTCSRATARPKDLDDYYGLGVRLGIYLSWVQAWVAFNFVPSEIAGALDTNTIFLPAVVLAMIRCTITQLIVQVDALILMHLGAGTVFGVLSIWGYRTSWYLREDRPGHNPLRRLRYPRAPGAVRRFCRLPVFTSAQRHPRP